MIDNKMSKFYSKIIFDLGNFDEGVFLDKLSCVDFEVGGIYIIDVWVMQDGMEGVYFEFGYNSIKLNRIVFVLEKQRGIGEQLMGLFKEVYFSVYCNDLTGYLVSDKDGLVFDGFYISIKKFI